MAFGDLLLTIRFGAKDEDIKIVLAGKTGKERSQYIKKAIRSYLQNEEAEQASIEKILKELQETKKEIRRLKNLPDKIPIEHEYSEKSEQASVETKDPPERVQENEGEEFRNLFLGEIDKLSNIRNI